MALSDAGRARLNGLLKQYVDEKKLPFAQLLVSRSGRVVLRPLQQCTIYSSVILLMHHLEQCNCIHAQFVVV